MDVRMEAKQKVDKLLKKREEKLAQKNQPKNTLSGKSYQTQEDKEIARQAKNKKRDKRRERATEEDHFDSLFTKYKTNLMKKLDDEDAKTKKGGKKR